MLDEKPAKFLLGVQWAIEHLTLPIIACLITGCMVYALVKG